MSKSKYCHTKELSATINQRTEVPVKGIEKPGRTTSLSSSKHHLRMIWMINIAHVSMRTLTLTLMMIKVMIKVVDEVVKVMIEKTEVLEQKVSRLKSNIKRYLIRNLITKVWLSSNFKLLTSDDWSPASYQIEPIKIDQQAHASLS